MNHELSTDAALLHQAAQAFYERFMAQEQYRSLHDHFRSRVRRHIAVEISIGPEDAPAVAVTHRDPEDGGVWTRLGSIAVPTTDAPR